jgi:tetratricopeptide (TPR) repeat protein
LIAKDENDYLEEWIDYHILLGVDRFYIYDNESRISIKKTLHKYVDKGWVVVIPIKGKAVQLHAYDHCLVNFGRNTRWIGFIDADEFIVPKTTTHLKTFLRDYEDFGGLAISSIFFGSNGHQSRPAAGQIASYQKRTPDHFDSNRLVKCIVQPDKILLPDSPHTFVYKKGAYCVNETGYRVDEQVFPFHTDKVQLNHYFCRSIEDMEEKLQRGGGMGRAHVKERFNAVDTWSIENETLIFTTIQSIMADLNVQIDNTIDLVHSKNINLKDSLHQLAETLQPVNTIEYNANAPVEARREILEYHKVNEKFKTAYEKNDLNTVLAITRELLKIMPDMIQLYTNYAYICLNNARENEAWQTLALAWKISSNNYMVLKGMTAYFESTHQFDQAEKPLKVMHMMGEREMFPNVHLALLLFQQKRRLEAVEFGKQAISRLPFISDCNENEVVNLAKEMIAYFKKNNNYQQLQFIKNQLEKKFSPNHLIFNAFR